MLVLQLDARRRCRNHENVSSDKNAATFLYSFFFLSWWVPKILNEEIGTYICDVAEFALRAVHFLMKKLGK